MKKYILLFSGLLAAHLNFNAQSIGGIINSYAKVSNITGSSIGVTSATAFTTGDRVLLIQMKGAVVNQTNTANFGDITSMGGAGKFEFLDVLSVTGNTINSTAALTNTYNFGSGAVQVVRVPKYCEPVVVSPLTCAAWNGTTGVGGILAFEAGTLTLNSDIDANGKGFRGGNYATSSFGCDNGNFAGVAGTAGGQKGESISAYIAGLNGQKGKQANGGGGGNPGNSGAGGGGNGGAGGLGGNQYQNQNNSGCSSMDERGIGGQNLPPVLMNMFMGGGGGGGYQDNSNPCSPGANGGGIIYIKANMIVSNTRTISANGANVTLVAADEAAGGGGAGGTIFLETTTITGNLKITTNGGAGGSVNNTIFTTDCHGTGGGGGGGVLAFTQAVLPGGTTSSSTGGAAGTIDNPASVCFGTTYGAGPGLNGTIITGLVVTPALTVPVLNVNTQSTPICPGENATITVSGATNYSWSTGSTNTLVIVSPSTTTSYTVTGGGLNQCGAQVVKTITVSTCTGISAMEMAEQKISVYPNPATGRFSIATKSAVNVFVCDETGRIIHEGALEKGTSELDLSSLANGIYFMKMVGADGTHITKLVKTDQ